MTLWAARLAALRTGASDERRLGRGGEGGDAGEAGGCECESWEVSGLDGCPLQDSTSVGVVGFGELSIGPCAGDHG